MTRPVERLLERLIAVKPQSKGCIACCPVPAHQDRLPSLKIDETDDGTVLVHCHAGCSAEEVVRSIGLSLADLFPTVAGSERQKTTAYRSSAGCTLDAYAKAKQLDLEFLRSLGLRDDAHYGRPVVRIPYFDRAGNELPTKLRLTLRRGEGKPFHWPAETHPVPYGLWRLGDAIQTGYIILVEGESDCHTLWHAGLPAIGIPGANTWKEDWARHFDDIDRIYIMIEPDQGGEAVRKWLSESRIREQVYLVPLVAPNGLPVKDPSDLFLFDPASFVPAMNAALAAAKPWSDADRPSGLGFPSAQNGTSNRAGSNLRFRTAREIGEETPENVNWYVEGYVAAGAITEFSGTIKAAGKTTLLTHMARAITVGGPFLGREATQTRVVYLTEQPSTSFREALRRAGLLDSADMIVLYWRDTVGTRWPEVVERAIQECRARKAGVLMVDTLPKFAGLRGDAENNAGDADQAMEPLQISANDGFAVVIARHERKAGGEVGESGRGSTAFGGGVDIVLSLKRQKGGSRPGVRELSALSRFDETPELLVIELTDEGYVALGDARAVVQADARRDVLAALPTSPETAVTIGDLVGRARGASRATVQRALRELIAEAAAAKVGAGVRGDPYRYHSPALATVTSSPSAHAATSSGQNEAATPCYACGTTSRATLDDGRRYCETCLATSIASSEAREIPLEWPG